MSAEYDAYIKEHIENLKRGLEWVQQNLSGPFINGEKLTEAMLNMPGSILFSEAVAVNVLAGATGSASGGMSIALTALAPKYLEIANQVGISPETLHRIASISSGGLDSLPHNGAVLTLLAVSHCTHKESYWGICVTTVIIPVIMSLVLALVWGLFI